MAGHETGQSKLVEAVIFISHRSMDAPNFSTGKLTKLLYMADCLSYHEHGSPITGATYVHFPNGPHPDGWHETRRFMENEGAVHVVYDGSAQGYHRYHMVPTREPNLELLGSDDVRILDHQIAFFSGYSEAAMENYCRQESGWLSTEDGEPIDWELTGVLVPPATLRRKTDGQEKANQYHNLTFGTFCIWQRVQMALSTTLGLHATWTWSSQAFCPGRQRP